MSRTTVNWGDLRVGFVRALRERGVELHLDRGAWARTAAGDWVVLPAVTDSAKPGSWWFGFDEEALDARSALGAILLCRTTDGDLVDFGLPASLLRGLAPRLVTKRGTSHRQFNVERRGSRYEIVAKGGERVDITDRRGDVTWVRAPQDAGPPSAAREAGAAYAAGSPPAASGGASGEERFFARACQGALEPLDATRLEEGATYLVIATPAPLVPASGSLRRLVAAARPCGLPSDLSVNHDHYAHGARRR
ncbi:MAG TPA: hypothetical protein VGQ83_39360 [Polyangia bacterium]